MRALLSSRDAERLLGDLEEEYRDEQRPALGSARAALWYWRQCLLSIAPLREAARRGNAPGGPVRGSTPNMLGGWLRDLRLGARNLSRRPTYAAVATLTLALGIGANAAIFSVVDAVLLRPLPYSHPERIHRGWAHTDDGDIVDFSFRVVEYEEAREHTGVFEAVGAEFAVSLPVVLPDHDPVQVDARMVTADFFDVFGVSPAIGRMFTVEEIAGGDRLVAVVSHGFWSRFLSADRGVVGRSFNIGGRATEIIGVLPEGYSHVSGPSVQVFFPYTVGTSGWIAHWLDLYVRLQPGVTTEVAEEAINGVIDRIGESDARSAGWHATLEPLHTMVVGDVTTAVWAVFGTVTFVLLIACVNVANLGLARWSNRRDEFAVRRALGAGRARLVRQVLAEQVSLTVLGGLAGIGVAWATLRGIIAVAPPSVPRLDQASLHAGVLAFTAGVTMVAGVLFGIVPALVGTSAKPGGHRSGAGIVVRGFVTSQVALAVTLLVGAGLLVKTVQAVADQEVGFDRSGALTFQVTTPSSRYRTSDDVFHFFETLRLDLAGLPGITDAGAVDYLPLSGEGAVTTVNSEERVRAGLPGVTSLQRRATEGFFGASGTPILEGREFTTLDRRDGETVVVISERLARQFFGSESAVGRRVAFGNDDPGEEGWMTVVGVVGDVRYRSMEELRDPQIYQAHVQSTPRTMSLIVRTGGEPSALIEPAKAALAILDPTLPMFGITTLQDVVDRALAGRRFTKTLFTMFAVLALALTVAGVYGVLAFAVQQRVSEIGVRMALGAEARSVTLEVIRRGAALSVAGLLIGAVGAALTYRVLEGLLFGVAALDPTVYLVGIASMAAAVAVASWVPAARAASIEPAEVLRGE